MELKTRNLANGITMTRIVGVGLLFWLTPFHTNYIVIWAVLLYTLICLTDYMDGWVARRFNQVTDMGKILDPLADKILVLVFLPLLQASAITLFPVFIIISREFAIMALRVVSAKNGVIIDANLTGKLKTALTLPICGLLFARIPVEKIPIPWFFSPIEWLRQWVAMWPNWTITTLVWTMVAITVWSFMDYFVKFIWQQALRKAEGDKEKAKKNLTIIIPNTATMLNLGLGLVAIYFGFTGALLLGAAAVLAGMILDALDGKLARRFDVFSEFGAKLDTKADYISFGIAPGVLLTQWLVSLSIPVGISVAVGFLHYAAVHYRLRRFDRSGHSDFFEGVPSPTGAATVCIFMASTLWGDAAWVLVALSLGVSFLMVSTIAYPHLDKALRHPVLRRTKWPAFTFFIMTLLKLIGVPMNFIAAPEIFSVFIVMYLLYPIYGRSRG